MNNKLETTFILNLLGELIFAFGFQLYGAGLDINDVYVQCKNYIKQLDKELEKNYYILAIEDIDGFIKLIKQNEVYDNLIPIGDSALQTYCRVKLNELWTLIEKSVRNGRSFVSQISSYN